MFSVQDKANNFLSFSGIDGDDDDPIGLVVPGNVVGGVTSTSDLHNVDDLSAVVAASVDEGQGHSLGDEANTQVSR